MRREEILTHGGFTIAEASAVGNYVSNYQKTENIGLQRDWWRRVALYMHGFNSTLQAVMSKKGIGASNLHEASNEEKERFKKMISEVPPECRPDLDNGIYCVDIHLI